MHPHVELPPLVLPVLFLRSRRFLSVFCGVPFEELLVGPGYLSLLDFFELGGRGGTGVDVRVELPGEGEVRGLDLLVRTARSNAQDSD